MSYTQYVSFVNNYAASVSTWLKNVHNINASTEEIFKVMTGEVVKTTPMLSQSSSSKTPTPKELIDEQFSNIELPTLEVPTKLIKKTNKKITPKEVEEDSESVATSSSNSGCSYLLKRGENKGQPCGKKCVAGSKFCSKHKVSDDDEEKEKKPRKKAVKPEESEQDVENDETPKQKGKGKATKQTKEKIKLTNEEFDDLLSSNEIKNKLPNLVPIPESDYLTVKGTNIVVKLLSNKKECELVGVYDDEPTEIREPSNDELKSIMKYNININNDKAPVIKMKNELDLTQIADIQIPDGLDDMENEINVPDLLQDD
jgi:hypothetical protein